MIELQQAQQILMRCVRPGSVVEVPLSDALYRTLAVPLTCDVDQPPFDRAVMDGYAVRSADVSSVPVRLRVSGRIPAGTTAERHLEAGEAMQINTGAPIPPRADAVVRVEHTDLSSDGAAVEIREAVAAGTFITPRATYRQVGDEVLAAGTLLTPLEIGVAASVGAVRLAVYPKPTVSVLTTGDEIVDIDQKPEGAQIRNSNLHLLEALVRSAHAGSVIVGKAPDDREDLARRIREGLQSDVLCITGGISMGAFDFVPEVLASLGAKFHIRKIAIKPGRPTVFATTPDGTLIFALPGNPISALIGFELLVRPALAALQGRLNVFPSPLAATLAGKLSATRDRISFVPARARVDSHGRWVAETLSWRGSGDMFGVAMANAFIIRSAHEAGVDSGETVSIFLLGRT